MAAREQPLRYEQELSREVRHPGGPNEVIAPCKLRDQNGGGTGGDSSARKRLGGEWLPVGGLESLVE